ncbi:MAG TPA: heme exporter protein CcmD [Xanthomonadales bacterium]|nr:heme exporter protein CcmD [Xanthomonadales bacterium]
MSHAPYIIASYAVFFVVFAIDAIGPLLARRRLLRNLRARLVRQQKRETR